MEIELIKLLQSAKNGFYDFVFTFFSYLASYVGFVVVLAVFLIISIILIAKNKPHRKFLIFTATFGVTYGLAIGLNYILKIIINRPRPYEVDAEIINVLPALGRSMPSGHMVSVTVASVFVFFAVLYFCKMKKSGLAWLGAVLGMILFLSMLSRMYLGQHYISDLIVGLVLGALCSILGLWIYKNITKGKVYDDREDNFEETEREETL